MTLLIKCYHKVYILLVTDIYVSIEKELIRAMSCYLVTVYQENMIPEIVKICKTYKEAEEAVKEVEVDDCIIGIERGSDEWLEI